MLLMVTRISDILFRSSVFRISSRAQQVSINHKYSNRSYITATMASLAPFKKHKVTVVGSGNWYVHTVMYYWTYC